MPKTLSTKQAAGGCKVIVFFLYFTLTDFEAKPGMVQSDANTFMPNFVQQEREQD